MRNKSTMDMRCILCNNIGIVVYHHLDRNRNNNLPSNLIQICPNCHALIHWRGYNVKKNTGGKYVLYNGNQPISAQHRQHLLDQEISDNLNTINQVFMYKKKRHGLTKKEHALLLQLNIYMDDKNLWDELNGR